MVQYTKVINSRGSYFCREYMKIKNYKNKVREIKRETVRDAFLNENAEIIVVIEESNREIFIDYFSATEIIRDYLGADFIPS